MLKNWFQKPLRLPKVPHSMQDLSHNFKTTTKFGVLTPIGVEEVVPSDKTVEYKPCAYIRLSPLQYPIMHQVHCRIHTFEVPFRIILGDKLYQDWLNSKIDFLPVKVIFPQSQVVPTYSVLTMLGYVPTPSAQEGYLEFHMDNGLDFLSLLVIWRDWYADSQINSAEMTLIDTMIETYQNSYGTSSQVYYNYQTIVSVLNAAMPKDYFTTARPEPQYGDPVNLTGTPSTFKSDGYVFEQGSVNFIPDNDSGDPKETGHMEAFDGNESYPLRLDLTIRELWRREQIQKYWDTTNTFGSRTREWLAGHMGVIFPDDRLMIPRLLQTVDRVVNIQEVLQTSATEEGSPLGAYAGKGTLAMAGKSFRRLYVEHGFVISLLSIVPETGYADSRPRYQFKKSIFDFAIPEFNNIGYQEIYKGEIYGSSSDPKGVFAYTPRFSEYRYHPNRVSNGFSHDLTLLDFHLARKFDSDPGLNPSFIKGDQDQFYRIFSDTAADMDSFLVDAAIIHKMWRPITYQPESMHL